uniref:(northern house mosquito) hypothetical protein n=1 Tax=Culex pipiens TaxID=7175 RepID=A0A8D8BKX0_CULPI
MVARGPTRDFSLNKFAVTHAFPKGGESFERFRKNLPTHDVSPAGGSKLFQKDSLLKIFSRVDNPHRKTLKRQQPPSARDKLISNNKFVTTRSPFAEVPVYHLPEDF